MINKEQANIIIDNQQSLSAYIYANKSDQNPLHKIAEPTHDQFIIKWKEFINKFLGTYFVIVKADPKAPLSKSQEFTIRLEADQEKPTPVQAQPVINGAPDQELINKLVQDGINKRLEEEKKQQEVNELREQVSRYKTLEGKLSVLADVFINKFFNQKQPKMTAPIQGHQEEQTVSFEEPQTTEEAIQFLIAIAGEETIIKLAKAVYKKPGLIKNIDLIL